MRSPLSISKLVVEHNESGFVCRKGVDHLLQSLLSRGLGFMNDIDLYLSFDDNRFNVIDLIDLKHDVSAILAKSQLIIHQGAFIRASNSRLDN